MVNSATAKVSQSRKNCFFHVASTSVSTSTNTSASADKLRILVLEDCGLARLMYKTFLNQLGYKCDFAKNLTEARGLYQAGKYHAAFVDGNLGVEEKGWEFVQEVRTQGDNALIIVAMSANDSLQDEFNKHGVNLFASKPLESATRLKELLQLSQQNQEEQKEVISVPQCQEQALVGNQMQRP